MTKEKRLRSLCAYLFELTDSSCSLHSFECNLAMRSELVKTSNSQSRLHNAKRQTYFHYKCHSEESLLFIFRLNSQTETSGDITKSLYLKQYITCDCPVNSSLLIRYVVGARDMFLSDDGCSLFGDMYSICWWRPQPPPILARSYKVFSIPLLRLQYKTTRKDYHNSSEV
jgi:hypothetical protein